MSLQIILYIAMLFGSFDFDAANIEEMTGQTAGESGPEEQFFSIELVDASIAGIRTETLNNKDSENMQHQSRLYDWLVPDYIETIIDSPRDAASGQPTGKRQHKPFILTGQ